MYDYKQLQQIPLYEIIEEYSFIENPNVKKQIFENFCKAIWKGNGRKRIYTKEMTFTIAPAIQNTREGKLFEKYSHVPYTTYQRVSESKLWYEILLRKILNLYVVYCDKEYIYSNSLSQLIKEPRNYYYAYVSRKKSITYSQLERLFTDWEVNMKKEKEKVLNRKIDITWVEFKAIVEKFLKKAFDNCVLLENYNKRTLQLYDKPEDCYYVKYFSKSVDGYVRNWQKRYFNVRQHKKIGVCVDCGAMIELTNNSRKYCVVCAAKRKRISNARSKEKATKKRLKSLYEPGTDLSQRYRIFEG